MKGLTAFLLGVLLLFGVCVSPLGASVFSQLQGNTQSSAHHAGGIQNLSTRQISIHNDKPSQNHSQNQEASHTAAIANAPNALAHNDLTQNTDNTKSDSTNVNHSNDTIAVHSNATDTADTIDIINIVAVGDVMIGSWYPTKGFLPDDDGKNSFAKVKEYLVGDVVFGNLEGALVDDIVPSTKCPMVMSEDTSTLVPKPNCYAFAMPSRYGKLLNEAGFNVMSIANNHVGDFGDVGRASTMFTLDEAGIANAGLSQKPSTIFQKNGVTYGFVAFAPNIGTASINDIEKAKRLVRELHTKVDIVLVSFHGGAEGAEHTRVPKQLEIYLEEHRGDVYKFAHAMIDEGADIVIGHGPHVVRAVEVYKDRFIAYSLGNFNTYGAFNVRGLNGLAPLLNVTLNKQGEFVSAKVISAYQTKEQGLLLDRQNRAFLEMKRLTELDFPNSGLKFANNTIVRQ